MTGRINYSPEADKQLNELDNWITRAASAEIARRIVLAIQRRPSATNARQCVCAGQPHNANNERRRSLSVPTFPWYY